MTVIFKFNIQLFIFTVGSWKLSKDVYGVLQQDHRDAMSAAISDTQGLRDDYYQDTHQTDEACFYYPEEEEITDFIELRGHCPTTITGDANFNLESVSLH